MIEKLDDATIERIAKRINALYDDDRDEGPDRELDRVARKLLRAILGMPTDEPEPEVSRSLLGDPVEGPRVVEYATEHRIGDTREAVKRYSRARDRGEIPGVKPRPQADPYAAWKQRSVEEQATYHGRSR